MSDPDDLQAFLDESWQHVQRGVADARAPARQMVLATVSPEGAPEARTVVLRRATQSTAEVEVHTDIRTAKIKALHATPLAALHVWVPRAQLQIRLSAEVTIHTGAEVTAQWDRVPSGSRVSYGTEPAPGTPIAQAYDYEKPIRQDRFAVLCCQLTAIDLVHLGDRHRRAQYHRANNWRGVWVAP